MICYIPQAQFQFCSKVSQYSKHYFCCFAETSSRICHLRLSSILGLVTVISHYYKEMWSSFLESDLHHCKLISIPHGNNKMGRLLIQQRPSMNAVWEMFPQHVTSWKSNAQWPTRSPDLSVCDHFLCAPLKVKCIPQEEMLYQILGYLWDGLEQSLRNAGLRLFEK
jgi:hypothetical protein